MNAVMVLKYGGEMKFYLTYEGPLHPDDLTDKKAIRKRFHPQLAELWSTHRALVKLKTVQMDFLDPSTGATRLMTRLEVLAAHFRKFGCRFVPLVNEHFGLSCNLDILMLRREQPGQIVMQGGDIDNRIKTLFDALRMPGDALEIDAPEAGDDLFFCLLQSDTMIDEVHVATDRLLQPPKADQKKTDVHLIIGVELKVVNPEVAYLEFAMH